MQGLVGNGGGGAEREVMSLAREFPKLDMQVRADTAVPRVTAVNESDLLIGSLSGPVILHTTQCPSHHTEVPL